MQPYFFILIASQLLPLSIGIAQAAPRSWSERELLEYAQEHDPRLKKAEAKTHEYGWKKTESLSGFLPTVGVTGSHFIAKKYQLLDLNFGGSPQSIPQIFPTTAVTLGVQIPIFDGFQNVFHFRRASQEYVAAQAEEDWLKFEGLQDIRLKYYQALAAQELLGVADQNVKTLEEHLGQVEALTRAGSATRFENLRVKTQLSDAQTERTSAFDSATMALRKLELASGLADSNTEGLPDQQAEESLKLSGKLPEPVEQLPSGLPKLESIRRQDLESAEARMKATSSEHVTSALFWVPKISLQGQWTTYNNRNDALWDPDQNRNAFNVGFLLTWNLFDGMSSISRERQAAWRQAQAEKELEIQRRKLPVDLELWSRNYRSSARLFQSKRQNLERAQEAVRLAQAGFKAGVRTNADILDAELDLFRARAGIVHAQLQWMESKLHLELATGRIDMGSEK